jgi:hypothetical protein
MTNAARKYFLQTAFFPLYSPLTASGAWESLLRDLGGFFVAPRTTLLAALYCWNLEDAHD